MFFLLHNLQQVNKHTKDAQPEWELEQHATPKKLNDKWMKHLHVLRLYSFEVDLGSSLATTVK